MAAVEAIHAVVVARGLARSSGGCVTFEARAHPERHWSPLGPTLHAASGCARIQADDRGATTAGPGDMVRFPPHARHWHGAAPDAGLSHPAHLEALDGLGATWMEKADAETFAAAATCA